MGRVFNGAHSAAWRGALLRGVELCCAARRNRMMKRANWDEVVCVRRTTRAEEFGL